MSEFFKHYTDDPYIPPDENVIDNWLFFDTILVNGYTNFLKNVQEPSLWRLSQSEPLHAYRFRWVGTFSRIGPVTRLMIYPDGTATIVMKEWRKLPTVNAPNRPVSVVKEQTLRVSRHRVQQFLDQLNKYAFWDCPRTDWNAGLDGETWLLEGTKGGKYHIVERWSPEDDRFIALCLPMISIARSRYWHWFLTCPREKLAYGIMPWAYALVDPLLSIQIGFSRSESTLKKKLAAFLKVFTSILYSIIESGNKLYWLGVTIEARVIYKLYGVKEAQ